jgi:amidase
MPYPLALPDPHHPVLALSALDQAARIRDGALTSRLLVELYLSRIQAIDPGLGAFVQVLAEPARREADRLDDERRRGKLRGPLHGVPTAIKDMNAVRGARLRFGSRAWRYLVSPIDDKVVRAVRRAGMPILGKTATSELAVLPIAETDLFPPARNPWDRARLAGGSSAGSGAGIAAGLMSLAPGSDGAGSIRIPSSLNGLVGLKPSRGLVPDDVGAVDRLRMTTNGPMGRCVDDVAALLDALARPGGVPGTALAASRAPVPKLRIGVILDPPVGETDPRVAEATLRVADLLRAAGHHVELRPRVEGSVAEFAPIYQALIARVPVLLPGKLQPFTRWFREQGRLQTAEDVARRFALLNARGRGLMDGVDVLLTPTVPVLAPFVGAYADVPPELLFDAVAPLGAFTAMSNVTGLPALSLPAGFVDGVPVGVQLIGGVDRDGLLLALGRQLEAAV